MGKPPDRCSKIEPTLVARPQPGRQADDHDQQVAMPQGLVPRRRLRLHRLDGAKQPAQRIAGIRRIHRNTQRR
jgi:hypothetical protein